MAMVNKKTLREATRRLVSGFAPQRIILFGSQARGTADARSDVDLLVILPVHGKRRSLVVNMDRALDGLGIARDIVVLTPREFERDRDIPGTIARPAATEGLVLYERGAQRHRSERPSMDRARSGGSSSFQDTMTMSTAIPYRLVAYHAQQCAEKCLKSYLVAGLTDFPYTHNIGVLLELCAKGAPWVPKVNDAATLSSYATTARYPGGANRVTKREAVKAIAIAERVLKIVTKDLREKKLLPPRRS